MKAHKLILPILLFFISILGYAQIENINSDIQEKVQPPIPLTIKQVEHYIETKLKEIELHQRIQETVKKDNRIHDFYEQRKILLEENGYTVNEYDAIEERVFTAQRAMDLNASLKSDKEFQQEIENIKMNSQLNDDQKEKTIQVMRVDRENTIKKFINPSKLDWPAVEVYQKELSNLVEFARGNKFELPSL